MTVEKPNLTKLERIKNMLNTSPIQKSNEGKPHFEFIENKHLKFIFFCSSLMSLLTIILNQIFFLENIEKKFYLISIILTIFSDLFLGICVFLIIFSKRRKIKTIFIIIFYITMEFYFIFNFVYIYFYENDNIDKFRKFIYFLFLNTLAVIGFDLKITTKKINYFKKNILFFYGFFRFFIFLIFFTIKNISLFSYEICAFMIILFFCLFRNYLKNLMDFKLKKYFIERNFQCEYYQGLINMLNKSFLSFNITNNTISSNISFTNLMKSIGFTESEIFNCFNFNKKKIKKKSSKEIITLKLKPFKKDDLLSNNSKYIQDSHVKFREDPLFLNLSDASLNNRESQSLQVSSEYKLNSLTENKILSEDQTEEIFLKNFDFLLDEFFELFLEDNSNNNNLLNINYDKPRTLSNFIRDIFYSSKLLKINENFIYKSSFFYDKKRNKRKSTKNKFFLELYFRKISTYKGEIIEFYFNDITTLLSKVEREKEQNKIRSLILAKISHEFKTPLITIIYILKNYIDNNNDLLYNEKTENSVNLIPTKLKEC